jgi:hypothetical protein
VSARIFAAAALAATLGGCAGDPAVAASLANAARPAHLPRVVACWEKEFEAAQFQGGYIATVDFVVEGGSSRIHDAELRSLEPVDREGRRGDKAAPTGRDPAAFRECLVAALNQSALPVEADDAGPGFRTASDLRVTRFRIAFTDASHQRRERAAARQANVLIGPRADRCQGLYSHDPPRDASTLYEEIAGADARSRALPDPDDRARELQKKYDAGIELRDRLAADLAEPGLPEANRARVKKALDETKETVRTTGARIGCAR